MVTALTLYPLESQATGTLSTASNMATGIGGTVVTIVATKAPAAHITGFGQYYPLGTTQTWPALGTIGAPDGHGWLYDSTSLEAQSIIAGNWTPTITLRSGINSCVADLHFRAYIYNTGTYTLINEFILSTQTINTTAKVFAFGAVSLSAQSFGTGDKLYCDLWFNVNNATLNGGCGTFELKCAYTTTGTTDNQLITPGYQTSSTQADHGWVVRGNVGQLTDYGWVIRGNIGHRATYSFVLRANVSATHVIGFRIRANVGIATYAWTIRANIGTPYHSPVDSHTYKSQMVMVYTPNGTFLDCWYDAPLLAGFKESINAAISPMKVVLPRAFENFDGINGRPQTIQQGNIVKYYLFGPGLPATGLLRYQGYIDGYEAEIRDTDGGETLTVSLVPQSSAVADHGIVGTHNFGTVGSPATYVDPVTMFDYFFSATDPTTGQKYAAPLALDPTNPISTSGTKSQFTFQSQTVGSCFDVILLLAPVNWFYRCNVDLTVTFNVPPVTAQHVFTIGQDISVPQYSQTWQLLKNVVQVKGGPTTTVGTVATTTSAPSTSSTTTIANKGTSSETATTNVTVHTDDVISAVSTVTTNTISAIRTGSDIGTYGERYLPYADNRILDATTANTVAQGSINALDQPVFRAKIRLLDYRGDLQSGLGYDIETIKVGDTCMLLDVSPNDKKPTLWGALVWDQGFWDYSLGSAISTVAVINALTYGFDYVDLELGSMQPSLHASVSLQRRMFDAFKMI